jgi:hypothetical protein
MHKTVSSSSKVVLFIGSIIVLVVIGSIWMAVLPTPVSAGFTPTPTSRPSDGGGGGGDDGDDGGRGDPCRQDAIYGRVTDLCLGEPARGVDISINGSLVRTDGDGRFSLTGITPGDYTITIQVAGEWQPDSTTVSLFECGQEVTVELNYNSCIVPTPTPFPAQFLPETGGAPPFAESSPPYLLYALVVALLVGASVWLRVQRR